jgi:hypothetical protein
MYNFTIILSSNSTKQLEKMSTDLKKIGKQCSVVTTGPVCFKGQRQLRFYNIQSARFVELIIRYKQPKSVVTTITSPKPFLHTKQ